MHLMCIPLAERVGCCLKLDGYCTHSLAVSSEMHIMRRTGKAVASIW